MSAAETDPAKPGFGQSFVDDLRFLWRFARCRRQVTTWRRPTRDEADAQARHEIVGRFGDEAAMVAERDGRLWIVRERDWHGWPDPPRFVFFVLQAGSIWCALDFSIWPSAWHLPD